MLRHLLMTPATKELPRSEGRILTMFQDWIHPLYRYRIPHTPTPRDRECICAYPLYTLRSSHKSPYDEPTRMTDGPETIYVNSAGRSSSSANANKEEQTTGAAAPTEDVTSATRAAASSPSVASSASTVTRSSSGFLSSFGHLSSLRARWAIRRRRDGNRLNATSPAPETCYRCDICDGLQRSGATATVPHAATATAATAERTPPPTHAANTAEWNEAGEEDQVEKDTASKYGGSSAVQNDEERSNAEDEHEASEEKVGQPTSTDIGNTAMEDAEIAELRHLDPFHVQVYGKPSWTPLLKRTSREVQAQLNRCGLRKREVSRYAAQASANSEVFRQSYQQWVRQEARRVREQQRQSMRPSVDTSKPCQPTLAPDEKAIIKGKLDTLHMAGYLARYAMAAYGLPFELNYFSSVRELTKLMAEPHRRYVCANSEEQLESMRRMLQGEEPDALLECVASRYSLRVGQPCWALFLDHAARRVILTFRGSLTPADMVVDVMEGYANLVLEHTPLPAPPLATEAEEKQTSEKKTTTDGTNASEPPQHVCTAVPLGFYDSVVEAGPQLLRILTTIHAQYRSYELCITGHSLGAIQASLFHLLYCSPWRVTLHSSSSLLRRTKPLRGPTPEEADTKAAAPPPPAGKADVPSPSPSATSSISSAHSTPLRVPFTRVVTCAFAAAPLVEKRILPTLNAWLQTEERRSGSRLINMTHGMDIITRLQIHALQETFTRSFVAPPPPEAPVKKNEPSPVSPAAAAAATGGEHARSFAGAAEGTAASPTIDTSEPNTKESVSDKPVVPVLAVPGSMYNMTAGTRRRYLLAVPPSATAVRERIILTSEAVLQHFPSLYLRGLSELLKRYEAKWNAVSAEKTTAGDAAAAASKEKSQSSTDSS